MERRAVEKSVPVLFLLKCILFSYILTAVLLLLIAFFLFKLGLSEQMVSIAIIAVYVLSTFFAGYIAGKKMENRKFLWGLLVGSCYFLVLLVISLILNQASGGIGDSFVTTFVLCGAGGMLGGMLS